MAIVISQPASIPKEELDSLGPVPIPLSPMVSQLTGRRYIYNGPGVCGMGIWECSPGRWQRTIMEEEFAHFIMGSARFVPEDGSTPIDLRAGDTIWFPKDSRGVWEISENVRKVYVIIDRPSLYKRAKQYVKQTLVNLGYRKPAQPIKTTGPVSLPTPVASH
ncbi:MAG TPA: cupin domain-containing protein [Rhizomicrobium sp.]|jgi:hypothetical protein|nr:cupin domain-containing protein [Rhizomicrobium sp.]